MANFLDDAALLERLAIVRAALDEISGGARETYVRACDAIAAVMRELEGRAQLEQGETIAGVVIGFEGLAGAATRLLAWHDQDDEFVTRAAEECAEAGMSSAQFERELWERLRGALAAEDMPEAAAVYERRRSEAAAALASYQGADLGGQRARALSLVSAMEGVGAAILVSTRTRPAFAAGNFAQRLREALDIAAMATDDRRRLIVEASAALTRALEREVDWMPLPSCFSGDALMVGSFAGVPVREEYNGSGAIVLLGGEIVAVVRAGDQTPEESERHGEAMRGA